MSKKSLLLHTAISSSACALAIFLALPALAQDTNFGPPSGIPDMNSFGPPAGIPNGPPDNIQMGPSEDQIQALQKKGEEARHRGEEQQLKGMKQGASGMERALKQFENTYSKLQKNGATISQDTKDKLESVRAGINAIKSAQTSEELQNVDQEELQEKITSLGDGIEKYQKMQGLKKMLASMDRGVQSFEKQLVKLEKQGLTIPADVTDDVEKLKAGLKAIKDAKTPEELDATNPDELGDLMEKVNESRPRLEMLAKWPRILRQADQQILRNQKELTKTKALVDRLSAKGIDLSADYNSFAEDVAAIKTARDDANQLMIDGKSEDAFNKMEEDFFNKLDNVGEHQRVIQMMSNLNRFTVEFKRGMATAQKTIKRLAKAKLDTSELQGIYDQAFAKGNEIVAMIKTKPIDEEAILPAMDEMENLKQEFQDKADELGGGQTMPWETKTPSQFQGLSLPKDFNKFVPAKTE